jgi:uncharacterized membrane protein YsdA (DUF1294 family)
MPDLQPTTWAVVIAVVAVANLFVFGAFFVDKRRAADRGARRIPEATLLILGVFGAVGAWLAVFALRHKTRKPWFLARLLLASAVVPGLVWACLG